MREAIWAEYTHEARTTSPRWPFEAIMSDNANLLDTNMKAKARRLYRIITTISAAVLRCG